MTAAESTDLRWQFLPFDALDIHTLYELLALRQAVFVVEQECPYLDADGVDKLCHHLLGWRCGRLVACLRVVPPEVKYAEPSIGRVLTAPDERHSGLGRTLLAEGLRRTRELYPGQRVRISAQAYLQRFYKEFGFRVVSEPYDEDGIPHIEMLSGA
ncbi:MAG TPA: GNAT family N-acetyltransferase [Candidatus Competibacteraceae bacterium]|nr:GNAT family N-acetyltransferase [Candidatus Competibacteraceae bacterium]